MRDRVLPATIAPQHCRAAISQVAIGDAYMSKFNWRSSDDAYYDRVEDAEMTGLAWECLRRNRSFQHDHQTAPPPALSVGAEFRQRWGLVFRSRSQSIIR